MVGSVQQRARSVPVGIKLDDLDVEGRLVGILLVPDLQATHSRDQASLERQVVFVLGLLVDILDDDVDGLAGVRLLEVDIAHEIDVPEDLRGLEGTVENLLGGERVGAIVLSLDERAVGQQGGKAAQDKRKRPHFSPRRQCDQH